MFINYETFEGEAGFTSLKIIFGMFELIKKFNSPIDKGFKLTNYYFIKQKQLIFILTFPPVTCFHKLYCWASSTLFYNSSYY